jgi:hypothetical protein
MLLEKCFFKTVTEGKTKERRDEKTRKKTLTDAG